jgi:hypothetical protein
MNQPASLLLALRQVQQLRKGIHLQALRDSKERCLDQLVNSFQYHGSNYRNHSNFRILAFINCYFRCGELSSVKYKDSRVSLC